MTYFLLINGYVFVREFNDEDGDGDIITYCSKTVPKSTMERVEKRKIARKNDIIRTIDSYVDFEAVTGGEKRQKRFEVAVKIMLQNRLAELNKGVQNTTRVTAVQLGDQDEGR